MSSGENEEPVANIHFTVMTKRGNKPQYAQVDVPIASQMATRFIEGSKVSNPVV